MNFKKLLCVSLMLILAETTFATQNTIYIKNADAKKIYNMLTGSQIRTDAAMSHSYKRGKGVLCQYVNADMTVKNKNIPQYDNSRYQCEIHFNENGVLDDFS